MNRPTYIFDGYSRKELRQALKKASPEIFDDVLRFLEDHPRNMGTGYKRELVWRYVRRYALESAHLDRLENIALKYLERPMSREFKWMALTMSRIGRPDFWRAVEARLNSENSIVALNAYCLFPYSKGIEAGEAQRLTLNALRLHLNYGGIWYKHRYEYHNSYPKPEDVLALLDKGANWKSGQLIIQAVSESDLPIVYYDPEFDADFASIDWTQAIPEILIPGLGDVLARCKLDVFTGTTVIYIAYAMRKIAHPMAVPLLVGFLQREVDYKFDTIKKAIAHRAIFPALDEIGTPEALEAIDKRMFAGIGYGYDLEIMRQSYGLKRRSGD